MLEFTLPLALFNFLPVGLTGLALVLLVRLLSDLRPDLGKWLVAGAVLVVAGGLSKASWKLLATLTGQDVVWLANALFPLIGPGFFLLAALAWLAFHRRRSDPGSHTVLVWALVLIGLACVVAAVRSWGLEVPRGWFLPFMLLTSLGNLGLMVLLIRRAWQVRQRAGVVLLLLNVVVVFGLQPIAMAGADTLALHWLEQAMTTLGAAALAAAVWLLLRACRDRPTA